jgi:hypothetical protein
LAPLAVAAFGGLSEPGGYKVTGFTSGIMVILPSLEYIARHKYSCFTEKMVEASDMSAPKERENIVVIGTSHVAEVVRA